MNGKAVDLNLTRGIHAGRLHAIVQPFPSPFFVCVVGLIGVDRAKICKGDSRRESLHFVSIVQPCPIRFRVLCGGLIRVDRPRCCKAAERLKRI